MASGLKPLRPPLQADPSAGSSCRVPPCPGPSAHDSREVQSADDAGYSTIVLDQDTPDVEYAKQNKAEIMRRCIDQLSPAHKEIIDLVYYQEKAVNEVSEILEIPPATVKTRMFYARKQLTESFRAAGIERGWP